MTASVDHFALPTRILHWLMAALILAMLFIGAGMLSTVTALYPELLAIHRPLGMAILILAFARVAFRLTHRPPPLPADLPPLQAAVAKGSHYLLYALMFALPLIGWAMQSAGGYPVQMWKGVSLFPILPHDIVIYGWLRLLHRLLAYAFFLLILGHLAAALFHALIRRDGVFESMAGT
jgi:cytochrome b561